MKLILLRHGQSIWNAKNLFTGWIDVELSEKGKEEAKKAGELLKEANLYPNICFTSFLKRAIHTAQIALNTLNWEHIDVIRSWKLNERHYGNWQGKNKDEVKAEYGEELFMAVRRGYDTPPPPIEPTDEDFEKRLPVDKKFENIEMPKSESLKDTRERVVEYFFEEIFPSMIVYDTVLIAAHGNSLRALIMFLEKVSPKDVNKIEIPTGTPIVYEMDQELNIKNKKIYKH
ncbi:2,3-bisphosphoglycerate-dependent phosphoglycerate mutase [Nitrosophilus kaiyonis]|uniref:2,3-bisphosphoglycerate-dependent phosphoglycerate mutase n=1 Tax=Nitrosophilus kaiyonis TaxID=2930200 RepID=UPI0024926E71|nr:2,3-diphosphoglycerate-dependent phosphoglycerate mutase [Nitrosophilus kaiyonis]